MSVLVGCSLQLDHGLLNKAVSNEAEGSRQLSKFADPKHRCQFATTPMQSDEPDHGTRMASSPVFSLEIHRIGKYYTYRMIAYDGGYWIVRDVLTKHGERGLVWLMRHPFVAGYDMRTAAATCRERALKDLSQERRR